MLNVFSEEKYQESAEKCLTFIKNQMNVSNFIYTIKFAQNYSDAYAGDVLYGNVEGLPNEDEKVFPRHINMADYYDFDYTGQVIGTWFNLENPEEYTVDVYVIRDTEYLICSCALEENGTWRTKRTNTVTVTETDEITGETFTYTYEEEVPVTVGTGIKEARLMHNGTFVGYAYSYFSNFTVRLYSYSDTEYFTDEVKIWDIGRNTYVFYSYKSFAGKKIAKVTQRIWRDGAFAYETVGIAGGLYNINTGKLPASFLIPDDDPQYNKDGSNANGKYGYMLNSRCFTYDVGLALLVFTTSGDYTSCKEMLTRMQYEQNEDGSFNFSYDLYIGQLFEGYVRTGSIGWFIWGGCYYTIKSGDSTFVDMLLKGADWILSKQIMDKKDERYGLLTGGYGTYSSDGYGYSPEEIKWCSTEHNCSALQGIVGASLIARTNKESEKYYKRSQLLKSQLIEKLYDTENNRFYQGLNDDNWSLDCTTWAGKTLSSILFSQYGFPERCFNTAKNVYKLTGVSIITNDTSDIRYNTRYSSRDTFTGYKPYANTGDYINAPQIIWSEGTLGGALLALYIGDTEEATLLVDEMIKLQNIANCTGGILYTTATYGELPWEFHAWESVVSSEWLYLIIKNPTCLFPAFCKSLHNIKIKN